MQTKNIRKILFALLTAAGFLGAQPAAQAGLPFPPRGNDDTPSMGQFTIIVTTNFQTMMANSGFPPSVYNPATHVFLSPVLYDSHTLIGRSDPLHDGDANDSGGVLVGTAGTNVSDSMLTVQPGGLGPPGTREVHTMIYSMNMTPGGGGPPAVRAGTNATTRTMSFGEVEAWSGALGLPADDFPAKSFFDVFVEVDIPAAPAPTGPSFPGATNLYNDLPLMIQNTNLDRFPPQVVYIHGMSTAVPIKFRGNNPGVWTNGQLFGLLTLAGHGVFPSNDPGTTATFLSVMSTVTPSPVEPQYSNTLGAPVTIAGTNLLFPPKGDDVTTSLGTFVLAVNPAFQPFMAGYPGWNPTTKRLTSPLLYDPSTQIGRSVPIKESSVADTNGTAVGTANTLVKDSSYSFVPPIFEVPSNTFEVVTEVRSLNMTGGGAAVRAGIAAPGSPGSYGEVESLSGASGDPYWDFPAKSFFDVFVQVDLPPGGAIPASFTVSNTQPLLIQNNNLTTFPPNVVYVHGNSSAVPVAFTADVPAIGAHAGDIFGIILLAGHGINFKQDTASQQQFQQAVGQMTEAPVAPQYAGWAVGLNVPLQISGIGLSNGIPQINGYCTVSNSVKLQSTPDLGAIGGPVWVDEVTTTGTTNSTFIVAPPIKPNSNVKFYRMVDNTR